MQPPDVAMADKAPMYTVSSDFNKTIEYKLHPPGSARFPINARQLWKDIIHTATVVKNGPYASVSLTRKPGFMSILLPFGPDDSEDFHERMRSLIDYRDPEKEKNKRLDMETLVIYDNYQSSGVSKEDDEHPSVMVFDGSFGTATGPREGWVLDPAWSRNPEDNVLVFAVRNSGLIISYDIFSDDSDAGIGRTVDMFNTFLELANSKWAIYANDKVYDRTKRDDFHGPLLYVAARPVNGTPPPKNSGIPLAFFKDSYRFEDNRFTYFYIPFGSPAFEPWDLKTAASKIIVTRVVRNPMKIRGLPHDLQEFASKFSSHEGAIRIGNQLDTRATTTMDRKEFLSALVHTSPDPGSPEAAHQRRAMIEHLIGVQVTEPITPSNIEEVGTEYRIGDGLQHRKVEVVDFDHPINNPLYSYRPNRVPKYPPHFRRRAHIGRPWFRPMLPPPIIPLIPPPVYVPSVPVYVAPPPPPPVVIPQDVLYGMPPGAVLFDPVVGLPAGWMVLSNGYRVPINSDISRMRGVTVLRRADQAPNKPIKEELIAEEQQYRSIDDHPLYKQKLSEQARLMEDMKNIRAQFNKMQTQSKSA